MDNKAQTIVQTKSALTSRILNNGSIAVEKSSSTIPTVSRPELEAATSWVSKTVTRTPIAAPTTPYEVIAAAHRKSSSLSSEKPMEGLVANGRQGHGSPSSNPQVALNFTYPPVPSALPASNTSSSSATVLQPSAFFSPLPNKKRQSLQGQNVSSSDGNNISKDANEPILDAVFEAGIRTPMHEILRKRVEQQQKQTNETDFDTKIPFASEHIASIDNFNKQTEAIGTSFLITPDELFRRKANVEVLASRYNAKRPQIATAASAAPASALASAFTLADDLVRALSDYSDGLQATLNHEQISSQMKLAAELDIAAKEVGAALDTREKIAEELSLASTRLLDKETELESVKEHFAELLAESTALAEQVEQLESDLMNVKAESDALRIDRDSIQSLLDEATREMTTLRDSTAAVIDVARGEEIRLAEEVLSGIKQERDAANEKLYILQAELNNLRSSIETNAARVVPPSTPFSQPQSLSSRDAPYQEGATRGLPVSLFSPSSFLSPQSLSRQQQNSAQLKEINKKLSSQLATKTAIIDGLQKELTRVRKSKDVVTTVVNNEEAEALRGERNFLLRQLEDQQKECVDLRALVEKLSIPIVVDTADNSVQTVSESVVSTAVQTTLETIDNDTREKMLPLSVIEPPVSTADLKMEEKRIERMEPLHVSPNQLENPHSNPLSSSSTLKANVFKRVIIGDVQLEWGTASPPSSPRKDQEARPKQKLQALSPKPLFDGVESTSQTGAKDILAQLSDISIRLKAIESASFPAPPPTQTVLDQVHASTRSTSTSRSSSDAWNAESLQKLAQKANGPIIWRTQDVSLKRTVAEPSSSYSTATITVEPPPTLSNILPKSKESSAAHSPLALPPQVALSEQIPSIPVEKRWLSRNTSPTHSGVENTRWQERSASVPPVLRTQPTPQFTVRTNPNSQQDIPQVIKREGALKPTRHAGPGASLSSKNTENFVVSRQQHIASIGKLGRRSSFSAEDWVTL